MGGLNITTFIHAPCLVQLLLLSSQQESTVARILWTQPMKGKSLLHLLTLPPLAQLMGHT
jgi:hypothetical protein